MTSLDGLLQRDAIVVGAKYNSRKQVLQEVSALAATHTGLDEKTVFDAVMEREQLGSTGVGEGVAIPHARLDAIKSPVGIFVTLDTPVEFEAIDDRKVDLVFLLLAPAESGAEHLLALSRVSRVFRQESIRTDLRRAQSNEAVIDILCPQSVIDAA